MTSRSPAFRRSPPASWRKAIFAATLPLAALPAMAQETFRIGIVSFLSGQAAESFGVPAVNGAKVLVDAFNKGAAPAPYNKVGFGGMKIEAVYVDENGGATKQVQELRNLYDREKVDAVVGYVGSGDCLAVAPVAEEMKKFLILCDCGTPRIFEDGKYNYVFRTAAHAPMDNVALARYLKSRNIKVERYNMINQDYAWGQDSRKDFTLAMEQLYKGAKFDADLLPKFGAGQCGTEVSALLSKPADILHSSLWGGDLQAFILQAGARRVPEAAAGVLGGGSCAAGPGREDAQRRDPRRARRLWTDVAQVGAQRLPEVMAQLRGIGLTVLISQSDLNHSRSLLDAEVVIERGANVGTTTVPAAG
ncbi:MAG: transporter substrate-binding protein [Ramlibacter sp.]|jgi:branched-chain amino acid transport system substrate-binding protein|nr:transporter substrate-binding protein [Ramlibacter sp.]